MSPEQRTAIMQALMENGQAGQKFLIFSRQFKQMYKQWDEIENLVILTENKVNETITKIRDDMKLDKRWGLNPQLGILERRDPPNG